MINCLPFTGELKDSGLYMRIRVDKRNLRSSFALNNGGSLRGLFQEDKTEVSNSKDLFFVIDEVEYATAEQRALLQAKLKQLSLDADSQKIREAVEVFFENSKELKRRAANSCDSLSVSEAANLQNEINKYAVQFNCATISLIRIETDETKAVGLRKPKGKDYWKREERFCRIYFSKDKVLDADMLTKLLDSVSAVTTDTDIRFVFGTKTVVSGNKKEQVVTIEKRVISNREEVAKQQADRSTLKTESLLGHQKPAPTSPLAAMDFISMMNAAEAMATGSRSSDPIV